MTDDLFQDENEFKLFNRAKDLYSYTSEAVGNENVISRRRRYPVGQRLETLADEILELCYEANTCHVVDEFEERQRLQRKIISKCYTLEGIISELGDSKAYPGMTPHKVTTWTQKSKHVRYICKSWMDGEKYRAPSSKAVELIREEKDEKGKTVRTVKELITVSK